MTYTKPEIDTRFNIISGEDIIVRAKKMQAAAQAQATKDIDQLKAMGEPIYYQKGKQLIREEADGQESLQYRLRADGTEEILGKLV
jgi:predicted DNA-binding transcriptional regulator YafY